MANNNDLSLGDLLFSPADPSDIPQDGGDSTQTISSSDDGDYTADSPVSMFGGDPFDADDSDESMAMGDDGDDLDDDSDSEGPSPDDMDALLSSLLSVPSDTTISHPKHGKRTLKKGVYKVRHKRPTRAKKASAHRKAAARKHPQGHAGRHRAESKTSAKR